MDRAAFPRIGLGGVLILTAGVTFPLGSSRSAAPEKPAGQASGQDLYVRLCASCHGEKGDGQGPAARFLNPRPRDFGEAQFRLVTTSNNIPTDADLTRVLRQGMPGSAMFPFGHLSDQEITSLVKEVRRLIRTGQEQKIRKATADAGEDLEAEDLARTLDIVTKPGNPIAMPAELPRATKESIARGDKLYHDQKVGCVSCHGDTGKGDGVQDQRNNDGLPTRPRDFTRGIFKSGRDARLLYARVMRGMPGTPMPAAPFLSAEQGGDIVNYILSLAPPEATEEVTHHRRRIVARRVKDSLDAGNLEPVWKNVKAAPIVVTPLWWRDQAHPDLSMAAVHDGKTLAIRLSWHDATANQQVTRADEFEDMAAVQLFKGSREPFLGMGATDQAIDLWLWRAGWQPQGTPAAAVLDDYPFDMPLYRGLIKGQEKDIPDFRTARAAGNLNARPNDKATASTLAAKGFGSTTFQPQASQLVTARAEWQAGRWTVVLRRPLQVKAGEGVALEPGDCCSIAFALWFGEVRDRNGQKMVSIWHDLTIE